MKSITAWFRDHRFPLTAFLVWRVSLQLISYLAAKFNLFIHPTFPYYLAELANRYPRVWSVFAFFDGIHYLRIAEHGYVDTGTQAFFPLYPLVIRFFHHLTGFNYLNSALLLTSYFSLLTLLIIWHTFNKQTAKKIILLLLAFPTSFFFASVYTESLFLFLFSLWIYVFKKSDFINACEGGSVPQKGTLPSAIRSTHLSFTKLALISALASATRITGLALSLATTYLIWSSKENFHNKVHNLMNFAKVEVFPKKEHFLRRSAAKFVSWLVRNLLITLLSFSGLLFYMFYLYLNFHDPLMFLHVQSMFGANRSSHLIIPLQTLWRYFKILVTATPTTLLYWRAFFELLTFLWGLFLIYKIYQKAKGKRQKVIYLITSLIMLSLSAFTGTLSSIPRYFLTILPLFYVWAQLFKSKKSFILTIVFLAIFQLFLFTIFITGTFIA